MSCDEATRFGLTSPSESRPESLRVEFKTDISQLPPLAQKWEELCGRQSDHDAPFFQSFAWVRHVAGIRTRGAADRYRPLVATVWRGGDLIGIWPLALRRSAGAWIARNSDDPFGQLAGVLFSDTTDVTPGVSAILTELRRQADGLHIEAVIVGSPLHAALVSCGAKASARQQAVFVDLRPYSSFKDFAQNVNSKTRKNLRNLGNRLRRAHEVEHTIATDPARLQPLLRETFEARVRWMQTNGRTSPAFRDKDFRTIVNELGDTEDIDLIAFSLTSNEASISTQWGFVYDRRYYAYMSAMNTDYDEFSPGRMHLGMVIESCFERGMKVLELMPPPSSYKLEWCGQIKDLETMILSFSIRGRLMSQLANAMIPAARRLSRALPESLRKSLVARFNRR
jgi:CelD/BcsL family acetyltransferase involved in cellulose biosynthesis